MKSRWNSLVVGGCNVFGIALLALSVTAGGGAVRAAGDTPSLESIALEPVTKLVSGIEQRVAALETSIGAFAHSFTARRIAAQELCVADGSGAQTCITKAQLDALLKGAVQTAQATPAAELAQAPKTREGEPAACSEKCVAPAAAVAAAAPSEAPAEPAAKETAPANEPPTAAAAVKEPAPAEGKTAAPSATPPAAEQPQAAADSVAGASSAPVEAAIPTPRPKPTETKPTETTATETRPADTIVATAGQPDTVIPSQPVQKVEEPATPAPATTPAEPKAVALEVSPVSEHKE